MRPRRCHDDFSLFLLTASATQTPPIWYESQRSSERKGSRQSDDRGEKQTNKHSSRSLRDFPSVLPVLQRMSEDKALRRRLMLQQRSDHSAPDFFVLFHPEFRRRRCYMWEKIRGVQGTLVPHCGSLGSVFSFYRICNTLCYINCC